MSATTGIRTYFDVPIPPWKSKKMKAGATTLVFVIKSKRIISKKNTNAIWLERGKAKKYIEELFKSKQEIKQSHFKHAIKLIYGRFIGSRGYEELLQQQTPLLERQRSYYVDKLQSKGLVFPIYDCKISMRFYFTGAYKQDLPNKENTIFDLLVDCNILSDDSWDVTREITTSGGLYTDEITENLCVVQITVNL